MVYVDPTLHVMSFNIRCDTGKAIVGSPDNWAGREPILKQFLAETQPDIVGVQELMYHQIPALQEGLGSKYAYIGESRDSSTSGELGAIFYNTERVEMTHWDQVWLSDTPHKAESITWGNDVTRIVTWGDFRDKATGREFTVTNTHFDHISEYSRIRSAEMLVSLFSTTKPVILMGDFNADSSVRSKEHDILTSVFQDTLEVSQHHMDPCYGTYNDYMAPSMKDRRIDWILSSRDIEVQETSTHTFSVEGRFPSDHLPISARLKIVA